MAVKLFPIFDASATPKSFAACVLLEYLPGCLVNHRPLHDMR